MQERAPLSLLWVSYILCAIKYMDFNQDILVLIPLKIEAFLVCVEIFKSQ